jgi:hypothetical protein
MGAIESSWTHTHLPGHLVQRDQVARLHRQAMSQDHRRSQQIKSDIRNTHNGVENTFVDFSCVVRHSHHHHRKGHLQAMPYFTHAISSSTPPRYGLHQCGFHQNFSRHASLIDYTIDRIRRRNYIDIPVSL